MSKFLYRSYVAIGDSLTEGLGDNNFHTDRMGKGWADRFAGLLALGALEAGQDFHYANLALRGSSARAILTAQLEDAIRLKPDLVTIMAGANDLFANSESKLEIERLLRGAVARLRTNGAHVVLLDIARPDHLALFRPLARKADDISEIITKIANEFGTPLVSVNGMRNFRLLDYWCSDMAHFSFYGHTSITNELAETLGIEARLALTPLPGKKKRSLSEVMVWLIRDVIPFIKRRLLGQTSGDGMLPKHLELECIVPVAIQQEFGELQHAS